MSEHYESPSSHFTEGDFCRTVEEIMRTPVESLPFGLETSVAGLGWNARDCMELIVVCSVEFGKFVGYEAFDKAIYHQDSTFSIVSREPLCLQEDVTLSDIFDLIQNSKSVQPSGQ